MVVKTGVETTDLSLISCMKGQWFDRFLLLFIFIGIAIAWQWVDHLVSSGPPTAYIYHDDILLARYPLEQNKTVHVQAEGHLGLTEIVINTDGARIVSSSCTTQYCVLSGSHHHAGDVIACVPNRILISIRGKKNTSVLDAISQ